MSVAAIIVLYNPDFEKLQRLYLSACNQVSSIIFVDNTPTFESREKNKIWIEDLHNKNNYYLSMNGNLGIATAQNKGIEFAKNLNAEFVLLLDQDSALPDDMVKKLLSAYQKLSYDNKKIAVVAPSFVDEKTGEIAKVIRHKKLKVQKIQPSINQDFEQADYVISSGSLIKLSVLDILGLMKDELFIDWVDIEWGLRAKQLGFMSYVIPSVLMEHSIGDESVVVGSNINLHSDFRNYFIVRNSVYLVLYSTLPINFKIIQSYKVPLYILFYSYHSKKPFYSLKLLLIAVKDAIFKKMGKGYFENKEL